MSDIALSVENIVKAYPARGWRAWGKKATPVRAVDGVSFEVKRGNIFGLLGPNGAGKTTILKMLTTLLVPSGGRARVEGFDPVTQGLEVRRQICMVIQETAVDLFLSVRENLLTYGRFHGLGTGESRRLAEGLIERFQLGEYAESKVQDLSGGSKRRVQVAKVFMVQTPVVFLDEFSTGMDPILKRAVMESLRAEAAGGRTIVLTTQVLGEAEELCDDILIIHRGRQVARGDLNQLKLLSEGVYEIAMTFDALPPGMEEEIAALAPLRTHVSGNSVELTVKSKEGQVLEIVTRLAQGRRLLRVEVSGASLEDIFVELTSG